MKHFFITAYYNIAKDKSYTCLCLFGTTITFIFIALALQLMHICSGDYPPMTNANSIIRLDMFKNTDGKNIGGIYYKEANAFTKNLPDFKHISLYHSNAINALAKEQLHNTDIGFVNEEYWNIYNYKFLYGKPFFKEDCINRKQVAVMTEKLSKTYFNKSNGLGEKFSFQGKEYEVIGVVKNVSMFSTPTESVIWVPYVFDKFIPNGMYKYTLDVLTPPSIPINAAKEKIAVAVQQYFNTKNMKVDFFPKQIKTLKETSENNIPGGKMFQYGSTAALLMLLIIPALNILTLNSTNANNRAKEIAVRRAFGAKPFSSFILIAGENFLITATGAITGVLCAVPVMNVLRKNIVGNSAFMDLEIIDHIDYNVILCGALPALIVFSLLSGGLPAYLITKRNIPTVLKE
ncbi:MAG: ABC transporter permease [Dysgonamonadaceae bacterium]|jgi:ABC-type antimicrobial peptide transport system permease subunit|nr:ABC transporter permease [Dysgonamonadaceae bacterium]